MVSKRVQHIIFEEGYTRLDYTRMCILDSSLLSQLNMNKTTDMNAGCSAKIRRFFRLFLFVTFLVLTLGA